MLKKLIFIFFIIFSITLIFYLTAEKILFIYDPFTLEASGTDIKKIRAHAFMSGKKIKAVYFNPGERSFEDELTEIALFKGRKTVITAYLYLAQNRENELFSSILKERNIYIYGPVFDYSNDSLYLKSNIDTIFYETAAGLARSSDLNRVEFYYQTGNIDQNPEKIITDSIVKGIKEVSSDIIFSIHETDFSDTSALALIAAEGLQSDVPVVLFNRYLNEKIIDLLKNSERIIFGFLYFSENNLSSPLNLPENTILFEFDYTRQLKSVFAGRDFNEEGGIHYSLFFKSNRFAQKK